MATLANPAAAFLKPAVSQDSSSASSADGTLVVEETKLWKCLTEPRLDIDEIQELINGKDKNGCDINMRDEIFGWSPVLIAGNAGCASLLKILLDAKAKADAVCNEGNNAVILAARRGHLESVEFLMSRKVDLDIKNNQGWTALTFSSINGHDEVASCLISATADFNSVDTEGRTACMWAARHGYSDIVQALLDCGINLGACDDYGYTAMDHAQEHMELRVAIASAEQVNRSLIEAARRADQEEVKQAIKRGANLGTRDENGWTAVMWSALHGSLDLVGLLVGNGASPGIVDQSGKSMELGKQHHAVNDALNVILGANKRMLAAAKASRWDDVETELSRGAWVNLRDDSKRNVLMWAATQNRPDAVHSMVTKGAQIDDRDVFGWTAFMWAVSTRSVESVSMLYYHNANFGIRSYDGDLGLHISIRQDDSIMMQILLTVGDVEEANVEGHTPLMIAACTGLPKAVSTLLAYGASVKAVDRHKRTPFMLAAVHGHVEVVRLMLQPQKPPPKLPQDTGDDVAPIVVAAPVAKAVVKKSKSPDRSAKKAKKPKEAKEAEVSEGSAKMAAEDVAKADATEKKRCHPAEVMAQSEAAERRNGGNKSSSKAGKAKVQLQNVSPPKLTLEEGSDELIQKTIQRREHVVNHLPAHSARHLLRESDKDSRTSLQLAAFFQHPDVVQILIDANAELEGKNHLGNTVLHEAVLSSQEQVVGMLLDAGIKLDTRNVAGRTAKDIAQDQHIRGMIEKCEVTRALPHNDNADAKAKQQADAAKAKPTFRVRIDNLPTKRPCEVVEEQLRALFKRLGAQNLLRIEVTADPINSRATGSGYADFLDAAAADLCVTGNGSQMNGSTIRLYRDSSAIKVVHR